MTDVAAGTRPAPTRRQLAERAERRRAALIAGVSSVIVFTALFLLVVNARGWPAVHKQFFSGADFKASFPDVLRAFWLNVKIFCIAEVLILICALLLAMARLSRSAVLFPVRALATVYVDVFRGVPVILVLYLLVFGVPALELPHLPNDPVVWATVALVLSYSAYVSEVFRSGIDSVHESQRAAARSLGLTVGQTMRFVLIPQGVRRVIPPLLNDFIALQKETALVSVVGPIEAARQAQLYASYHFNFTSYVAAAAIFLAMTIPLTRLTDRLIARQKSRTGAGAVR